MKLSKLTFTPCCCLPWKVPSLTAKYCLITYHQPQWKWSEVAQSSPTLRNSMDCTLKIKLRQVMGVFASFTSLRYKKVTMDIIRRLNHLLGTEWEQYTQNTTQKCYVWSLVSYFLRNHSVIFFTFPKLLLFPYQKQVFLLSTMYMKK